MKKFKMILLSFAMMLISTINVFAANVETTDDMIMRSYVQPGERFSETFSLEGELWGETHYMDVNVTFSLAYEYEEGSWVNVQYVDIDVKSVYIDNEEVSWSSSKYVITQRGAYREIIVNGDTTVRIDLNMDEYGEVYTYAGIE